MVARLIVLYLFALIPVIPDLNAQVRRASVPLGDAIDKALSKSTLAVRGGLPFHLRVSITEPQNPASPYKGMIEEWWLSPQQWRREVSGPDGLRQTIVFSNGRQSEKDEGEYFPLWLRNFVTAIFDPVPDAAAWTAGGGRLEQIAMPDGRRSDACARGKFKVGTDEQATDAFSNVCFDGDGRLHVYVSPRYSMQFDEYQPWGEKQVARRLVEDPEPGTSLVGLVEVLEDETAAHPAPDLFSPLPAADDSFRSVPVGSAQLEQLAGTHPPIVWPAVRSGNLRGHLAMYISVDRTGRVREAWPLNSDNAGLEDSAREQVRQWKLKTATDSTGKAIQVDGALGFLFETRIDSPLPVLTGSAVMGHQVTGCSYNPVLPRGLLARGQSFVIRASVNEVGKLTGESYPQGVAWDVVQKAGLHLPDCTFHPYLVEGKPTYYFIDFVFTAP